MWKQISLTEAPQGYLAGQNVKLVDLVEETVVSLQDAFKNMQESAVFFAEDAPQKKYNPPDNATEAELVDWIVNGSAPEPKDEYDRKDPTASAAVFGTGDGMSRQKGSEPATAPEKCPARKISDIGKLRSLRAAGWDVDKIAIEFGCSGQTVRNAMKREGIE